MAATVNTIPPMTADKMMIKGKLSEKKNYLVEGVTDDKNFTSNIEV
jgi:hypothetical protein